MTQTTKKSLFSDMTLKAIAKAQAENPGKSIDQLVTEIDAIYNELKAAAKGVNGDAYTRATAIAEYLKEHPEAKKDEVIKAADEAYVTKTGRASNIRETTFAFGIAYHALLVFNVVGPNRAVEAPAVEAPAAEPEPKKGHK